MDCRLRVRSRGGYQLPDGSARAIASVGFASNANGQGEAEIKSSMKKS